MIGRKKTGSRILLLVTVLFLLLQIYVANPGNNVLRRLAYRNEVVLAGSGRIQYWLAAWERFLDKPILGAGFGISNNGADDGGLVFNTQGYKIQIDNSYIALLEEIGILGCVIMLPAIVMPLFKKSWLVMKMASSSLDETNLIFVAIIAAGFFNAIFEGWLLSVGNICGFSFWVFATFLMLEKDQKAPRPTQISNNKI